MNKPIYWTIGVLVLVIAYYLLSPIWIVKNVQDVEVQGNTLVNGDLIASAHDVSGSVKIVEENGRRILRFENLDTINGPDLRIYMSADLNAEDYIDLGAIKGTKGNVNYELPDDLDLNKYDKVLIWCRAFKVLFSYADLK